MTSFVIVRQQTTPFMSVAPQPQRELWSMDPTPVVQPNALRPESASRYPTAAWPAVPSNEPGAPPAYKMPSPLIPSSPAPEANRPAKSIDEDLKDLLSGFNTPAPAAPAPATQMLAPSFPTQSSAPISQVGQPPSPAIVASVPQVPSSPSLQARIQAAPPQQQVPNTANASDVTQQLSLFMRRVEENFTSVCRQLAEVDKRLIAIEQATKEVAEQNRTNAAEKKRMLENLQQQLMELKRQTAMATVSAPPQPQPQPQPQPPPVYNAQPPMPTYAQPAAPLSYASQRLPPLQPATSLYMPPPSIAAPRSSKNDQEEADRLLALRLQEEINRDNHSDLLPGVDTAKMHSRPTPGGPSRGNEASGECPICGLEQPLAQIESHVNKHLEENPGVATQEQKEGFLSWLFATKKDTPSQRPEPPKLTPPKPSPAKAPTSAQPQVLNLGQPGIYPPAYRYGTQGMQIPPGMQLATIPPGAPIPPGAVPLGNYPGVYPPPSQLYYSQAGQAP